MKFEERGTLVTVSDIVWCVAVFSSHSVVVHGVTGHVVVPRHRIVLHSDFLCREVLIAVCPEFSMDGVTFILGNYRWNFAVPNCVLLSACGDGRGSDKLSRTETFPLKTPRSSCRENKFSV